MTGHIRRFRSRHRTHELFFVTQLNEPTTFGLGEIGQQNMVSGGDSLSAREVEVARAYAGGQSYKEISRALGIAPATVRAHIRTIYRKLDVTTKISLAHALHARHPQDQSIPISSHDPATAQNVRVAVGIAAEPGASERSDALALGFTEDLILELTRFKRMIVLSTRSAADVLQRRNGENSFPAGADYAVTGTLRQSDERIQVSLCLENLQDGQHVWAERFETGAEGFFQMGNDVLGRIAATILGRTEAAVSHRAARREPSSLAAYECVMRGKSLDVGSPELESQRKALFSRALELDPDYALAHALLAQSILLEWDRDPAKDDRHLDMALASAKRAASIDSNDPYCQFVVGFVQLFRKSFDVAEACYRRVAELGPNDAELIAETALFKAYVGEPGVAFGHLARARQLDPNLDPAWLWHAEGLARFVDGQFGPAVSAFERSATSPLWVLAYQAAAAALEDRSDLAKRYAARVLDLRPEFRAKRFADREPLRRSEDRAALLAGLMKAGLPS